MDPILQVFIFLLKLYHLFLLLLCSTSISWIGTYGSCRWRGQITFFLFFCAISFVICTSLSRVHGIFWGWELGFAVFRAVSCFCLCVMILVGRRILICSFICFIESVQNRTMKLKPIFLILKAKKLLYG